MYTISDGLQITSKSPVHSGTVEFPEKQEKGKTYVTISSKSGLSNWFLRLVDRTPMANVAFELKTHSM